MRLRSLSRFVTWDPSLYFPEQVEEKLEEKTSELFPEPRYTDLTDQEKDPCDHVFQTQYSLQPGGAEVDQLTGGTGSAGELCDSDRDFKFSRILVCK